MSHGRHAVGCGMPPSMGTLGGDALAMQTLRQIVQELQPGVTSLWRLTDDRVIAEVEHLLDSGALRACVCAAAGSAADADRQAVTPRVAEALRAIQAVWWRQALRGQYRVVAFAVGRQVQDIAGYEVVPHAEARELLGRMATDSRQGADARRSLEAAVSLLAPNRGPHTDERILLLRRVVWLGEAVSQGKAVTPSSMAAEIARKREVHWIEIELVDEEGVGIPGQPYSIVTPDDKHFEGVTDKDGCARVDDLVVGGQCMVSFPALDRGAWHVG